MTPLVKQYDAESIGWINLLVGIYILIVNYFKLDKLFDSIPIYIISSTLHGIGLIFIRLHLDYAFNLYNLHDNWTNFDGLTTWELIERGDGSWLSFVLCLGTFFGLYILNKVKPTEPWLIYVTIFGVLLGEL